VTRHFYKVMLGKGSAAAGQARAESFVGADYALDRDLTGQLPEDWREFNDRWIPHFLQSGKPNRISAGLAAGQLWTVAKGLQIGDVVLSPTASNSGELYVGIVSTEYHYRPGEVLPHRRGVEWQSKTIKREECSTELRGGLGFGSTVCSLDRYGDEISQLVVDPRAADPIVSRDPKIEDVTNFVMERHLEDFLVENWEQTELGSKYDIYTEDGAVVGQQYPVDKGFIDILAISKDKKVLLVVELKKGKATDVVVGQVLRYMGYVTELIEPGQKVRGAIIALEDDRRIHQALSMVENVDFYRYEVQFSLLKQ